MTTLRKIVEGARWLSMVLDGLESNGEVYFAEPYWIAKRHPDRIHDGAEPYRSFHDCVRNKDISGVKSLWDRSDGTEVIAHAGFYRFPLALLATDSWFDKAYALTVLNPCIEAVGHYFKDEPYWLCCLPNGRAAGVMDHEFVLKLDEATLYDRAHINDVLTRTNAVYPRSLILSWSDAVVETPALPKPEPARFEVPKEYTHGPPGLSKAERNALHKEFARRSLYGLPDMLPLRK